MFLIVPDLIKVSTMDLVTQIFLVFVGLIVASQSLKDESKTTDTSVFEAQTPPGFMKFFPMKDEEPTNPVKFHFWSSKIDNEEIMKFPDWFHYTESKPEESDIKVEKNADKDELKDEKKPKNTYMWNYAYAGTSANNKNEVKEAFAPDQNVFLSNAYPNWMVMAGLQNNWGAVKKDEKGEKLVKAKDITKDDTSEKKEASLVPEIKAKPEKKEPVTNDATKVEKQREPSLPDSENVKLSKTIPIIDDDIFISTTRHPITMKTDENIKTETKKAIADILKESEGDLDLANNVNNDRASILNSGGIIIPIQVLGNMVNDPESIDKLGNIMLIPMSIDPNQNKDATLEVSASSTNQAPLITPHSSEEKPEGVVKSEVPDLGNKIPSQENNEEWKKLLLNLLQNAKPMYASMSGPGMNLSQPNTPQIVAMLAPMKENPKLISRSADNPPSADQNMNTKPSTNAPNSNDAWQNVQNQNNPSNAMANQGLLPNNGLINQQNRPNQGNMLVNPSFPPYINQNNYPSNAGQPILVPYNTNNVPLNYVLANPNVQQGNPNLQNIQQSPNQPYNNNLGLVSQGNYPIYNNNNMPQGQLYAMVPLTNGNGNMNSGPNPYLNNNVQLSQNRYQGPMYNLVPVNTGVANTKDEIDE